MSNLDVALRLSVAQTGLANITNLIDELQAAGESTTQFEQDAERLRQEITQLGQQQAAINAFRQMRQATDDSAIALQQAQQQAQALGRAYGQLQNPTAAQTREMQRARDAVRDASAAHQANVLVLQNQRAAMSQLGLSTTNLAQHQIDLNQATAAAQASQQALTQALQNSVSAANAAASAQNQAAGATTSVAESIGNAQAALVGFIAGGAAIDAAQAVLAVADEYKNLEARIGLAIDTHGDMQQAMQSVSSIANQMGQSLTAVGELYAGLARSTALSQESIGALTDTVAKSIALSGGSAAAANAAITQLNQALVSGFQSAPGV